MDINYQDPTQTVEVAGFIGKTFQILNNQLYSKIIYWGPTGKQFVIKDIIKFQQTVLPKFFRHNKINSFIRQLNMYGFHKSRKDNSKSIFSHPLFLKDKEDLLPSIKRKIKQNLKEEDQIQNNFNTPVKLNKSGKQCEIETVMTGRELIQFKEKPMPSFKHFQNNFESYGASFKHLFESKQTFSRSNLNLNFSLNKISLNFIHGEGSKLSFKEIDEDNISIAGRIEYNNERQKDFFGIGMPSLPKFINPSCFFNSFDSKK